MPDRQDDLYASPRGGKTVSHRNPGAGQAFQDERSIIDALVESEAKFRGLAEQSLVGISIHRPEGYLYANPKFAVMLGYTPDEMLGRRPLDIIAECDRERARELIERRLQGDVVAEGSNIFQCLHKDGSVIDVESYASAMKLEGRMVSISIAVEITERLRDARVLKDSMRQVRALSERVMKIQQQERDHIARDLYDELGQTLTALKVNLQMLEPHCSSGEAEFYLTEALVIVSRALRQVRGMMLDLRPAGINDFGLAVALENTLTKMATSAGWQAHFDASLLPSRQPAELEMACFRVAQEALTNALRHASAKSVWVQLELHGDELHLIVRDDGAGFDADTCLQGNSGFGILGMQERVRQLGGRLLIESGTGGSQIHATFKAEQPA